MFIPIRTDNRLRIRPVINHIIIVVNIAVFLLQFIAPVQYNHMVEAYKLTPSAPQLHQFFTYMFLHGGWAHLIGNMLFLWVFGNAINDRFGHVAYLAFYLGGGVLSGIGHVILSGHAPVVGASGAISAVTGCFLVLFPRVRVTVLLLLVWIIPMEISALVFLGFQFIFNLWQSATMSGGGIAYAAHASGYIYGIFIAVALLWLGVLPRDVYDMLSLWKTHRRRQGYRRMVKSGYDPFGGSPPPSMRKDATAAGKDDQSKQDPRIMELRKQISLRHSQSSLSDASEAYLKLIDLDPDNVLPQQQQFDIANKLMSDNRYNEAVAAYEKLIKYYPGYAQLGDIKLMLGIIYGRYLHNPAKARANLAAAIETLTDPAKIQSARQQLSQLDGQ